MNIGERYRRQVELYRDRELLMQAGIDIAYLSDEQTREMRWFVLDRKAKKSVYLPKTYGIIDECVHQAMLLFSDRIKDAKKNTPND